MTSPYFRSSKILNPRRCLVSPCQNWSSTKSIKAQRTLPHCVTRPAWVVGAQRPAWPEEFFLMPLPALQEYSWPGNVRELQNVIERSLIIVDSNEFSVDKNWFSHEFQSSPRVGPAGGISTEREQIEAALARSRGKVSGRQGAAVLLGMPASTLESKIRALRINKHAYKGA